MKTRRRIGALRTRAVAVAVVCGLFALPGCLGTTPEEALENSYGDEGGHEDELHRPGQDCLACHSERHNQGGDPFVFAGTVYLRAADKDGLNDVLVEMIDAKKRVAKVRTNTVGNFMVSVGDAAEAVLGEGDKNNKGWAVIDWEPAYPVNVVISKGADKQVMVSPIWRNGGCGFCHKAKATATEKTVERIFLQADKKP